MTKIVHPFHYRVYRREGADWFVKDNQRIFHNATNEPIDLNHVEQQFGLTQEQVIIELFRINGGKPGYYLANLRDRKYYYCGLRWEDIKTTLQNLGVGRADPLEK